MDIGTGDGLFVYHSARKNPDKLYIGIDSNPRAPEKISTKICRKPCKGGAPNALYLHASAENIPEELNEIAHEVYVFFPWGSLLRGIASGEPQMLGNIKRICCPGAILRVMFALDQNKDQNEIQRLKLPTLSMAYIESFLVSQYKAAGFDVVEKKFISFSECSTLPTSWAKRLRHNKDRSVFLLVAHAI